MAKKFNKIIKSKTPYKLNLEFNLLLKLCLSILNDDNFLSCEYALIFLYKFIWFFGDNFKQIFWDSI